MSEEEEPFYCPNCAEGNTVILGKTKDGFYVLRCNNCNYDWLVKNVTGKVRVTVGVED